MNSVTQLFFQKYVRNTKLLYKEDFDRFFDVISAELNKLAIYDKWNSSRGLEMSKPSLEASFYSESGVDHKSILNVCLRLKFYLIPFIHGKCFVFKLFYNAVSMKSNFLFAKFSILLIWTNCLFSFARKTNQSISEQCRIAWRLNCLIASSFSFWWHLRVVLAFASLSLRRTVSLSRNL